ncbi:MAG: UDP-N-acetylmuramate dehydrogenase, partial [Kiritimatiellae bacterium]|nr:UDP-N-acetylmuramate dehydrogenase [Kiritimatiellia bacterium]
KRLGKIDLPVPGIHNVLNALAATAVGLTFGLNFKQIQRGLTGVSLPRRRFERIVEKRGLTVISDYAHHPSEIKALVRTARKLKHSRILAVFQPHRYTRTLTLGAEFPAAFDGVDELVLVPVYAASETPLKGGTIWDLYERFRHENNETRRNGEKKEMAVSVAGSLEQAWSYFKTQLRKGDLFLIVGAGDVEKIAGWTREGISDFRFPISDLRRFYRKQGFPFEKFGSATAIRLSEPMARRTTMKVGGTADVFVDTGSLSDLTILAKWCGRNQMPFRLLGSGSNVVVSDLGVRGVTAKLSGGDFGKIQLKHGLVVAGAGVPLARLLAWLEERGLSGLEFLEGIPGTVGGAVRMNAGAWGHEIGEKISWIHCLNLDGSKRRVRGKLIKFGYRKCSFLDKRILLETAFNVLNDSSAEIRKRRMDFRKRREWMKGLHCAGSVFKNPENNYAGRLIENVGLKGQRVGGAVVSKAHANVIVTDAGARGSDIMALIEKIRAEVMQKFKVHLDTEVVLFE